MNIKLRTATPDDAKRCGTICYEAFTAITNQHNFPPDLPSAEVTIRLISKLIGDPRFTQSLPKSSTKSSAAILWMSGRRLQASVRSRSIRLCKIGELDAH